MDFNMCWVGVLVVGLLVGVVGCWCLLVVVGLLLCGFVVFVLGGVCFGGFVGAAKCSCGHSSCTGCWEISVFTAYII